MSTTEWKRIAHLPPEILTRLRLDDPNLVLARGRTHDVSFFYACIAELRDDDCYHFLLDITRNDWLNITLGGERDLLAQKVRWAPGGEPPWLALVTPPKGH